MMKIDDIVNGTDAYRSELCKQVQNDSGVECIMLEKDLWVTYVLEKIFADKELSRILRFKGGTSLSKAHRIIRRFSEDVDLVLDMTSIGCSILACLKLPRMTLPCLQTL